MTPEEATEIETVMRCERPGGGTPSGHCAACCYGTGYDPTCQEDADLLDSALVMLGRKPIDWQRAVSGTVR